MAQFGGGDDGLEPLRFLQHLDGKAMRQVVLADDDLDIDAEVVFIAENFDHSPARILGSGGPVGDLDVDYQAFEVSPLAAAGFVAQDAIALGGALGACLGFCVLAAAFCWSFRFSGGFSCGHLHSARDDDVLSDLLVHGGDEVVSRAVMKDADHGGIAAGEHAQDAALGAAIVAAATQLDQHLVAVHG